MTKKILAIGRVAPRQGIYRFYELEWEEAGNHKILYDCGTRVDLTVSPDDGDILE